LNKLDKKTKSIQFTKEIESENSIAFLDLHIKRVENKIETKVFRKTTHSNRYLNFNSYHSLENKKSVIRTLVSRAYTHVSNPEILDIQLNNIMNILESNNYPIKVIKNITEQVKKKFDKSTSISQKDVINPSKIISIPYIKGTGEQIKNLMSKHEYKIVYKKGKNLKSLLSNNKTKNTLEKNNVVYNISCNDCDVVYAANTERKLETRVNEDKNALTKSYIPSHVVDHAKQTSHNINWDETKISYVENNRDAKGAIRKWDIEKLRQKNIPLINKQFESKSNLPPQYIPLVNKTIQFH
jgi:hypothetical protein